MELTPLEEEAVLLSIDVESPMTIRHVFIEGPTLRTRTSVIERQLQTAYGARTFAGVYTALHDAERRFKGMGVFKSLSIACVPAQNGGRDEVDLVITAEEKSAAAGGLGVHTDPDHGQATLSLNGKLRGPLGFGTLIEGSVDRKGRAVSDAFSIEIAKRHAFASETAASIGLRSGTVNCRSEASYDLKSSAVTARVATVDRRHALSYTCVARQIIAAEHSELSELRPASARVLDEMGLPSLKSALAYTLRLDTRNDAMLPTAGSLLQLETEFAGTGGDARFLQTTLDAALHVPLGLGGAVFALRARATGVLHQADATSRSIADRVYLGGINSLRGFTARGVGGECQPNGDSVSAIGGGWEREPLRVFVLCLADPPRSHTHSCSCFFVLLFLGLFLLFFFQFDRLGGDLAANATAMVHFPLPLPLLRDIGMRGCFHAGGGSLVDIGRTGTPVDALRGSFSSLASSMRYSAGLGILAATPFGRVDVSYAYFIKSLAGDVAKRWQFGVSAGD